MKPTPRYEGPLFSDDGAEALYDFIATHNGSKGLFRCDDDLPNGHVRVFSDLVALSPSLYESLQSFANDLGEDTSACIGEIN